MKLYDVYGIGNGIVDILLEVTDEDFASLGLEKATMRLVEAEEQKALIDSFHDRHPVLASGGSVANSVITLSQLGGKSAFACSLGDDRYGLHYKSEFDQLGIELGNPLTVDEVTGTCAVLITPDAERTMRTCLGVSSALGASHIDKTIIEQSKWIFIEGYVFSNPEHGQEAIRTAVQYAKACDTKIAITFSEAFIVEVFGDALREAVEQADLIFANESEAMAYTSTSSGEEAFAKLAEIVPNCVVTLGERGCLVRFDGFEGHVPAAECKPIDLTGAGDAFAGSFLFGITHGIDPQTAAQGANYISSKVISHIGARLHSGVRTFWEEKVGKEKACAAC